LAWGKGTEEKNSLACIRLSAKGWEAHDEVMWEWRKRKRGEKK